jgi:L-ascorbate metabolism protein UlaG (beta-lactamase superfamily)
MKVTKYPQSCFKLEKNGQAIMIDIGNFAAAKYKLSDFGAFEALLITHQHADHIDPGLLNELSALNMPVYGNQDVFDKFPDLKINVVRHKDSFELAGFHIMPIDLPHFPMIDGASGPPNTGYVIDDMLFHPGDGVEISDIQVDNLAAPLAGPSISMRDTVTLIKSVGAKLVIPMHYDNPAFYNDPNVLKERYTGVQVIVLNNGESVDLK